MADMKQVVQAIDTATGKIKSVYKKLTDIGNGMYAEAVAVNIDTVTVTDVGIKDPVSGNVAGVDGDRNLQVKGDVTATLTGSSVSIEERFWLSTDPDPVPVSNRALGVVIDVATNEMTTKYWNGASWEVFR